MSSRFKEGDVIHRLSDTSYYDDNDQLVSHKGKPVVGVVTGFDKDEKAIVTWQDPKLAGRTETRYSPAEQFSVWNGSQEERLIRRKILVNRKKDKKKRFDIGTLVSIKVVDYDSDRYDRFRPHRKDQPTKNETGIIVNKDGLEMYFEIYLQQSMKTVWREYDEIRKF